MAATLLDSNDDTTRALRKSAEPVAPSLKSPPATLPLLPTTANSLSPPRRLLGYELIEKIGSGGMGTVYRAMHTWLGRTVAIKFIAPEVLDDPEAVSRFTHEARAIGALDHPHVVRATDAGCFEGVHFLVTEFVEGSDLAQLVKQHGPLSVADACLIARQAALGLQHAHERGLVHRDVKPSNLRLDDLGIVKLLDFGVARLVAGQMTMTGTGQMIGTLDFLAPEQASNPRAVDARADIYSLGCTLSFLLTGEPPFHGPAYDTPASKIQAHLVDSPIELIEARCRHLPRGVVRCLERMLAKDPADRYSAAAEVAQVLDKFVVGANLPALSAPNPRASQAMSRATPPILGRLFVGGIAILMLAWRWLWRRRRRRDVAPRTSWFSFSGLLLLGLAGYMFTQPGSCQRVEFRTHDNAPPLPSPISPEPVSVGPVPSSTPSAWPQTITNTTGGETTKTPNKFAIPKPRRSASDDE